MHKHLDIFDRIELLCYILSCINDLFLYMCLLVLELNGSHQHSPWSIRDRHLAVKAAVPSMEVVLLLLIHWFIYLLLFLGFVLDFVLLCITWCLSS